MSAEGDAGRRRPPLASGRGGAPGQRLVRSLGRRRRLRAGLVEVAYVAGGLLAAMLIPAIQAGPMVDAARSANLLTAVAGGVIPLVAVVFSLLFLTVQFASTTLSPRLNLFRDTPLVWHAFGFFIGVFVFAATAALRTSSRPEVSALVPATAIALTLAAMAVARQLQTRAYRSLQMGPVVQEITRRGRVGVDQLYEVGTADSPSASSHSLTPAGEVRWRGSDGYIRQIDVRRLFALAVENDATVELPLRPGQFVRHGDVVLRHSLEPVMADADLVRDVEVGADRTWDQDPLFAFRLLVDIGLRAMSPAVNDPATCRHVIDAASGLLRYVADRHLFIGHISDTGGHLRLVLHPPTWDEFVGAAFDELIEAGKASSSVAARLAAVLDDLVETVPATRRGAVEDRRGRLTP
jgi:uncharacterized membrane protein